MCVGVGGGGEANCIAIMSDVSEGFVRKDHVTFIAVRSRHSFGLSE